jgi:hypothetical protein
LANLAYLVETVYNPIGILTMAICHHGTLIVADSNVRSGPGTGVVKPATAFPTPETSLLVITTDPADFAPGVVSICNASGGPYKGIVFVHNLIQTPGYRFENPARAPGLLLKGLYSFTMSLLSNL